MILIEQEPHFWELYRDFEDYYLSIAIDMSSVVSCWDLRLHQDEILAYEHRGRESIVLLAKNLVVAAYKGDYSRLESSMVKHYERQAMHKAFNEWKNQQAQKI